MSATNNQPLPKPSHAPPRPKRTAPAPSPRRKNSVKQPPSDVFESDTLVFMPDDKSPQSKRTNANSAPRRPVELPHRHSTSSASNSPVTSPITRSAPREAPPLPPREAPPLPPREAPVPHRLSSTQNQSPLHSYQDEHMFSILDSNLSADQSYEPVSPLQASPNVRLRPGVLSARTSATIKSPNKSPRTSTSTSTSASLTISDSNIQNETTSSGGSIQKNIQLAAPPPASRSLKSVATPIAFNAQQPKQTHDTPNINTSSTSLSPSTTSPVTPVTPVSLAGPPPPSKMNLAPPPPNKMNLAPPPPSKMNLAPPPPSKMNLAPPPPQQTVISPRNSQIQENQSLSKSNTSKPVSTLKTNVLMGKMLGDSMNSPRTPRTQIIEPTRIHTIGVFNTQIPHKFNKKPFSIPEIVINDEDTLEVSEDVNGLEMSTSLNQSTDVEEFNVWELGEFEEYQDISETIICAYGRANDYVTSCSIGDSILNSY
ncbi:hypothetical protein QTN25_005560 [Entamoeba marina]